MYQFHIELSVFPWLEEDRTLFLNENSNDDTTSVRNKNSKYVLLRVSLILNNPRRHIN